MFVKIINAIKSCFGRARMQVEPVMMHRVPSISIGLNYEASSDSDRLSADENSFDESMEVDISSNPEIDMVEGRFYTQGVGSFQ